VAAHKGVAVEVVESLLVNQPPSSLSLSSQTLLLVQVAWVAAAIVDSLGQISFNF
jgi:hypothetical protein